MQEFKQDLEENQSQGGLFTVQFLFSEHTPLKTCVEMQSVFSKYIGEVSDGEKTDTSMHFFAKDYVSTFKEGDMPVQLMILECEKREINADDLAKSQMWDCPNSSEVIENCNHIITATDFLGSALDYKKRAELLMNFTEAMLELFPSCKAVYFPVSMKLLNRDYLLNPNFPKELRFVRYAVNVRFFNIQGTDDCIIDTIGMSTLFLPDMQYHFKNSINPNMLVEHAYNLLQYNFDNNCPIESGQTITGVDFNTGIFNNNLQWKCQFENSLIQPLRPVIDVNTGEFAAGNRQ